MLHGPGGPKFWCHYCDKKITGAMRDHVAQYRTSLSVAKKLGWPYIVDHEGRKWVVFCNECKYEAVRPDGAALRFFPTDEEKQENTTP